MEEILGGLTALIVFLGISSPILIIGLVYYFMKRLEHKQILAAIEKGTPLSELKPPKQKQNGALWIRSLTFGIALLVIALGLLFVGPAIERGPTGLVSLIMWILLGVAVASLVRGLLYRKYQPQSQPSDESIAAEKESKISA
jgi:hypothetical protein